jgi:hypothetical protein
MRTEVAARIPCAAAPNFVVISCMRRVFLLKAMTAARSPGCRTERGMGCGVGELGQDFANAAANVKQEQRIDGARLVGEIGDLARLVFIVND